MSNQDLIVKEMTQIPADIAEMWGKPLVPRTEDLEAYRERCLEIAKSVGPADMIESTDFREETSRRLTGQCPSKSRPRRKARLH
jgi:hypothetical protein